MCRVSCRARLLIYRQIIRQITANYHSTTPRPNYDYVTSDSHLLASWYSRADEISLWCLATRPADPESLLAPSTWTCRRIEINTTCSEHFCIYNDISKGVLVLKYLAFRFQSIQCESKRSIIPWSYPVPRNNFLNDHDQCRRKRICFSFQILFNINWTTFTTTVQMRFLGSE